MQVSGEKRQRIEQWLKEACDLRLDLYVPHSGASGDGYFVRSVEEIERLVAEQTASEILLMVIGFRCAGALMTG